MYCSNCGNKVDEKAVVCVKCGVLINNKINVIKNENKQNNGRGIASTILGIIAVYISLTAFRVMPDVDSIISSYNEEEVFFFAIGIVLLQTIFAIISLLLALFERKNNKNGFNTCGFILSIISLLISFVQFIYVVMK